MANIDRVIEVNISKETTVPSVQSFGYPLIASEFLKTDYKANWAEIVWDGDFVTDNTIVVTINGTDVSTSFSTDHDTTMDAIKSNIETEFPDVTVTLPDSAGDNRTLKLEKEYFFLEVAENVSGGTSQPTGTVTYEDTFDDRVRVFTSLSNIGNRFGTDHDIYNAASAIFSQSPSLDKVYIGRKLTGADGSETWDTALDSINLEDGDWYGIIACTRTQSEQETIADWALANKKLYGAGSDDSNIISGTGDLAEYLSTNSNDRAFVLYHPNSSLSGNDPFPEAAWIGQVFPKDPGSATWKFKTLSGTGVYTLEGSEINTALEKNANIYTSIAGVHITQDGTLGNGEFIDVTRGIDWLTTRIQQLVFMELINNDKIAYTNAGIQLVVSKVKAALQEGVDRGLLRELGEDAVSAPNVEDISDTAKGNRLLPDINWTVELAGAIHETQINGTITL